MSVDKVMVTMFWETRGITYIDYLQKVRLGTAETIGETLGDVYEAQRTIR